jgi:hypothetical protein
MHCSHSIKKVSIFDCSFKPSIDTRQMLLGFLQGHLTYSTPKVLTREGVVGLIIRCNIRVELKLRMHRDNIVQGLTMDPALLGNCNSVVNSILHQIRQ